MKKLLVGLLVLGSISSYSQVVTSSGDSTQEETFTLSISSALPTIGDLISSQEISDELTTKHNYENYDIAFKTTKNSNIATIDCTSDSEIEYRSTAKRKLFFNFDSPLKCDVVKNCILKLQALSSIDNIKLSINRSSKDIEKVEIPSSCEIDSWASVDTISEDGLI